MNLPAAAPAEQDRRRAFFLIYNSNPTRHRRRRRQSARAQVGMRDDWPAAARRSSRQFRPRAPRLLRGRQIGRPGGRAGESGVARAGRRGQFRKSKAAARREDAAEISRRLAAAASSRRPGDGGGAVIALVSWIECAGVKVSRPMGSTNRLIWPLICAAIGAGQRNRFRSQWGRSMAPARLCQQANVGGVVLRSFA